jgi:hypothetical protein
MVFDRLARTCVLVLDAEAGIAEVEIDLNKEDVNSTFVVDENVDDDDSGREVVDGLAMA